MERLAERAANRLTHLPRCDLVKVFQQCKLLFLWLRQSLVLSVRGFVVPLLCALLLLCSADCALTTYDLRYSHPNTPIYKICDKPLDVPEDVDLWGYSTYTGRLVTGEDALELRTFYGATAFYEYDPDAPLSSLQRAPPEWGLTCPESVTFLADEDEFLPKRCPAAFADAVGRGDPRWIASPGAGKPACFSGPVRVHVCVRPRGIDTEIDEWTSRDVKGNLLTHSDKVFAEAVAKAELIFVFDKNAPAESVYWFVTDVTQLSCPDKPPPKPYSQTMASGMLDMMAMATTMSAALRTPKQGDGQTTETSSAEGKGPPLNFLESLARNLSILGALAQSDTSGSLKDANGSRYGIPGGKNVGGPDLLPLQAAVGTFAVISNPFKTGKEFIETIATGLARKKAPVILNPKVLSKEIAEKLATEPDKKLVQDAIEAWRKGDKKALEKAVEEFESFGKAMAPSLREAQVILPYSRAQIFTAGWGGKYQAHHILEVAMAEDTLNMGQKAINDIPAIILSEAEHKAITNKLTEVRNEILKGTGRSVPTPQELWTIYQKAYQKYPTWLEAIKGHFPGVR